MHGWLRRCDVPSCYVSGKQTIRIDDDLGHVLFVCASSLVSSPISRGRVLPKKFTWTAEMRKWLKGIHGYAWYMRRRHAICRKSMPALSNGALLIGCTVSALCLTSSGGQQRAAR